MTETKKFMNEHQIFEEVKKIVARTEWECNDVNLPHHNDDAAKVDAFEEISELFDGWDMPIVTY